MGNAIASDRGSGGEWRAADRRIIESERIASALPLDVGVVSVAAAIVAHVLPGNAAVCLDESVCSCRQKAAADASAV